jgi:hypothetical protein
MIPISGALGPPLTCSSSAVARKATASRMHVPWYARSPRDRTVEHDGCSGCSIEQAGSLLCSSSLTCHTTINLPIRWCFVELLQEASKPRSSHTRERALGRLPVPSAVRTALNHVGAGVRSPLVPDGFTSLAPHATFFHLHYQVYSHENEKTTSPCTLFRTVTALAVIAFPSLLTWVNPMCSLCNRGADDSGEERA